MRFAADLVPLEHLILLALARLGDDAHGMPVRRLVAERAHRNISIASVYAALDGLERKGLISSWAGPPSAARGNRPRRCLRLEAPGLRALDALSAPAAPYRDALAMAGA